MKDTELKKSDESWRDLSGRICCPGEDLCAQDCDNTCPVKLFKLGDLFGSFGAYSKAIPYFEEAVKLAPDYFDAVISLANMHAMIGDFDKALESFNMAVELAPCSTKALSGLVAVEEELGLYKEALQHCDKLEELGDPNADWLKVSLRLKSGYYN